MPKRTRAPTIPLRLFGPPTGRRAWRSLAGNAAVDGGPLMEACGITDVGRVRADNQDQFVIAELERGLLIRSSSIETEDGTAVTDLPQGYLLAVADGVGGNAGGGIASAIAIDTMAHYALTLMPWVMTARASDGGLIAKGLRAAIRDAQSRIARLAKRHNLATNMATTFTMAYVTWPDLYVLHVGDSRCYVARHGSLLRMTHDHTIAEEMIAAGVDPKTVRGTRLDHTLARAVSGTNRELAPELRHLNLLRGDVLLLCSDGLTGHLSDRQLLEALVCDQPAATTAQALVDAANAAGGADNITAVVGRF